MEVWKSIKGFENHYEVSNLGRVRNILKDNKIVAQSINKHGYAYVSLSIGHRRNAKRRVHRLVAEAFILNPNNLPQVNHLDECKTNNNVNNLEWSSASHNINYGNRNKKHSLKLSKPIFQYMLDGSFLKRWDSMTEAEKATGFSKRNISRCCRGKQPTAYGYRWEYDKSRMV